MNLVPYWAIEKSFSKHENVCYGKLYLGKNMEKIDEFCLRDFVGLIKLYNYYKFGRATFNSFS